MSKIVTACGSGITDQHPTFLARLSDPKIGQMVMDTKIEPPVLQWPPCRQCSRGLGRELVIVNTAETAEDDLMRDFVAMVTSLCARLYGCRHGQRKTKQVLAALQQNGFSREPEATISNFAGQKAM